MKIAISAQGDTLASEVDQRFGRCGYFIILDLENQDIKVVNNMENANLMGGAGIQAVEAVVSNDADAVITGHCGPKAFSALQAAGVKVFTVAEGTVQEALDKYKMQELTAIEGPDVDGHWS